MKRRFRHWTPQYVRDRIDFDIYFRRNRDVPWLSREANEILETMILPSDVGVEFGSGVSTAWFARRMKHLTSVEHDASWYERVSEAIRSKNLDNVAYVLASISDEDPARSDYVRVAERFADASVTFVLIDGWARDHCAVTMLPKVAPGGMIIVDDIQNFLDYPTTSPYARTGRGPRNDLWRAFAEGVSDWRLVIARQGIKDTGIWIKPAAA